jgi:formylglycine-generating enzyme required for sulfatase activity
MKIFISYHTRTSRDIALILEHHLKAAGHQVWLDKASLRGGADWWSDILTGIEWADVLLCLLSPGYLESPFCKGELDYAFQWNKPRLPLKHRHIPDVDIPPQISTDRVQIEDIEPRHPTEVGPLVGALVDGMVGRLNGFRPPISPPRRPGLPVVPRVAAQTPDELYNAAMIAWEERNLAEAKALFEQVVNAQSRMWGRSAAKHLTQLQIEAEMAQHHMGIMRLAASPLARTQRDALVMYEEFLAECRDQGVDPALFQHPQEIIARQSVTLPPTTTPRIEVIQPPPPPPATPQPGRRGPNLATGTDEKGVPMVYVPAGTFLMGSTEAQVEAAFQQGKKDYKDFRREWVEDQLPQHQVTIEQPFWLDLTPVTNAAYAEFAEKGYQTEKYWTPAGWEWVQTNKKRGPVDYPDRSSAPNQPRVGVTWFEAYAYCQWRGGRLPTEAEWEWAARGPKNRIYPWGDTFIADHVIYYKNSGSKTAPVGDGIRMAGASWVGALDMSGNVWEWCHSIYQAYPYDADDGRNINDNSNKERVLRGGSWYNNSDLRLRVVFRNGNAPDYWDYYVGCRLARSS